MCVRTDLAHLSTRRCLLLFLRNRSCWPFTNNTLPYISLSFCQYYWMDSWFMALQSLLRYSLHSIHSLHPRVYLFTQCLWVCVPKLVNQSTRRPSRNKGSWTWPGSNRPVQVLGGQKTKKVPLTSLVKVFVEPRTQNNGNRPEPVFYVPNRGQHTWFFSRIFCIWVFTGFTTTTEVF